MKLENIAEAASLAEKLKLVRKTHASMVRGSPSVLKVPVRPEYPSARHGDVREDIDLDFAVAQALLASEESRLLANLRALGADVA